MQVADLRMSRRGKHHTLISRILDQLASLAESSALIIPLESIGELSVAGLRSAVTRAAPARNFAIKTHSDEKNFYVWKKHESASKSEKRVRQ